MDKQEEIKTYNTNLKTYNTNLKTYNTNLKTYNTNLKTYEYLMPLDGEPTHWMPLPTAPKG